MTTQMNGMQIFHLVFLLLVCLVGTIGNIMTIVAVRIERKLRESLSNMFVINLALADLVVCSIVVPMMISHDAHAEILPGPYLCYIMVIISGIACHTAAATMTGIAVTRYVAASRATRYHDIITKGRVFVAIIVVWLFAALNTTPILLAWLEVDSLDLNNYVCVCFDGTFALYYTLGPVIIGHFLPHAITVFCYYRIMRAMRKSRKRVTSSSVGTLTSVSGADKDKEKRKSTTLNSETEGESQTTLSVSNWSKHEVQLLKTSMWIIGFFSFCWIPYGILVILQDLAPIELKKTFGSLCLLSFSLNPVIYGLLSKSFRQAYKRIIVKVFCGFCCFRGLDDGIRSTPSLTNRRKSDKQRSSPRAAQYQASESSDEVRFQYGRSSPSHIT
ncbi:melatonin receptor type 1B-like isoform X2 [Styela clava]|nr:beta-1 adrenergic receptor-like isoform X2 [Styela clava]XP_039269697.1 beta-1 adrenergic receptor-like isoform X2 [Styela clava]XP_039269698.1 beta-1 adrenergic receptor-like isoform X2 [Styela clava]